MKPLARGLLIGCGLILLIGGGVAGGVAWYVSQNYESWEAQGKASMEEGKRAGAGQAAEFCVDGAMERLKKDSGMVGVVDARVWMQSCLGASDEAATPTGFCDDVPAQTEITGSIQWRMAQCKARGFADNSQCGSVIPGVQQFCDTQRPAN
jgi:hypothetical protein